MKKNLLATFSLGAVAVLTMVACAPKEVSKEEGLKAFDAIYTQVKLEKVESPHKISVDRTYAHETVDTSKEKDKQKDKEVSTIVASYDLDNHLAYYQISEKENDKEVNHVEQWVSYKDGKFLVATIENKLKTYQELAIEYKDAEEIFLDSYAHEAVTDSIGKEAFDIANAQIKTLGMFEDGEALDGLPQGSKINAWTEFRADEENNFRFEGEAEAVAPLEIGDYSEFVTAQITIESSILTHLELLESAKQVDAKTNTYVKESTTLTSDVTLTADIKLPDLKDFTKVETNSR